MPRLTNLNVALGGTLYQDIESQYENISVKHTQKQCRANQHIRSKSQVVANFRVLEQRPGELPHRGVKQLAADFVPAWSSWMASSKRSNLNQLTKAYCRSMAS